MKEVYVVLKHEGVLCENPHTVDLIGVFKTVDKAKGAIDSLLDGKLLQANFINVAGTLSYATTTETDYTDYQIIKERI